MSDVLYPVVGGLIIGLAVVILLWGVGRVAGISGIFWQSLHGYRKARSEQFWRLAFVIGLITAPWLLVQLNYLRVPEPSDSGWATQIISGLLVGFGTRLGSGCTSGHGICGLARFSKRSMVATGIFMAMGMVTVGLVRHVF